MEDPLYWWNASSLLMGIFLKQWLTLPWINAEIKFAPLLSSILAFLSDKIIFADSINFLSCGWKPLLWTIVAAVASDVWESGDCCS